MCVGFVLFFLAPGCLVALAVSSASVALVTFWRLALVAVCSYSTLAMLT